MIVSRCRYNFVENVVRTYNKDVDVVVVKVYFHLRIAITMQSASAWSRLAASSRVSINFW